MPFRLRALILATSLVPGFMGGQSISFTKASIRLHEQEGARLLGTSRRVYTSYFNSLRTRYIVVTVAVEYRAPQTSSALSVSCEVTRPDGSVRQGIYRIPLKIDAGSTSAEDSNIMFGAGDEGWQTGVHKVTCSGSSKLAETQFQMSPGPSLLLDTEIRLKAVKFFPTGSTATPRPQRNYMSSFSSAQSTRIGVELTFVMPAYPGKATGNFPVDCAYLSPGGQVLGTVSGDFAMEPGSTGGTLGMGLGWDQPGNWATGMYMVICQIHGRPISVDRFEVW